MKERSAIWPWKGDVPPHLPRPDNMPKAFLLPGDPGRVDKAAEVLDDFRIVGQNRAICLDSHGRRALQPVPCTRTLLLRPGDRTGGQNKTCCCCCTCFSY